MCTEQSDDLLSIPRLCLVKKGGLTWSGHGLHEAAARAGIVIVIVFLVAAQQAVEPEGDQANQPGEKAEATTGSPLLDQLTHGAALAKISQL